MSCRQWTSAPQKLFCECQIFLRAPLLGPRALLGELPVAMSARRIAKGGGEGGPPHEKMRFNSTEAPVRSRQGTCAPQKLFCECQIFLRAPLLGPRALLGELPVTMSARRLGNMGGWADLLCHFSAVVSCFVPTYKCYQRIDDVLAI